MIGMFLLYSVMVIGLIAVIYGGLYLLIIRPTITHWHREAAKYRAKSSPAEEVVSIVRGEIRDEFVRRGH